MLGHLIRKEILNSILGFRFLVLSALGALMVWWSLYDGYAYYRVCLQDYRRAQAVTEERIREIMGINAWNELSSGGYLVHKPPTPMSIFARGLEPVLGRSIPVLEENQRLKRSPAEAEPILGVFPPLDTGVVVQVVLGLFVLLLTYDAICGEKEAGTLRLIASFPVSRNRLLLGKLIGVLIPTLSAFALPLFLGIAVVLLMPDVQLAASELTRLGLILLAFGFYLTALTCAGLLGSCLTHRASTSFVLLVGLWVVAVIVLPRLSLIFADTLRPAPSVYEVQAEKKIIANAAQQKRQKLLAEWEQEHLGPGKHWWQASPEKMAAYWLYFGQTREEARLFVQSQYERLDETFRNRTNARLGIAVALARLSPAFALKNAVIRLAGTGVDRHRRFLAAFERHWERHQDWYASTKGRDMLRASYPAKYGKYQWDVSDLPRFTYLETWPAEDVQTAIVDIGALAVWGLIFFLGAYVATLRYDLR